MAVLPIREVRVYDAWMIPLAREEDKQHWSTVAGMGEEYR
jgi:hypothetical protein